MESVISVSDICLAFGAVMVHTTRFVGESLPTGALMLFTLPLAFTSMRCGENFWVVDAKTFGLVSLAHYLARPTADVVFVQSIIYILSIYAPYFTMPSRYMRDSKLRRCMCQPWSVLQTPSPIHTSCEWRFKGFVRTVSDPLLVSSLTYVITGLFIALALEETWVGGLEVCAGLGSLIYHRSREGAYLNIDTTFAASLLITTIWSWFLALVHDDFIYAGVLTAGFSVGYFLLIACGAPSEAHPGKEPGDYLRRSRHKPHEYEIYHVFWHLVSAVGPLLAALFYKYDLPEDYPGPMGGGYLDPYNAIPAVPAIALLVGACGSFYTNIFDDMPWD